jgi:hypothetical protein
MAEVGSVTALIAVLAAGTADASCGAAVTSATAETIINAALRIDVTSNFVEHTSLGGLPSWRATTVRPNYPLTVLGHEWRLNDQ